MKLEAVLMLLLAASVVAIAPPGLCSNSSLTFAYSRTVDENTFLLTGFQAIAADHSEMNSSQGFEPSRKRGGWSIFADSGTAVVVALVLVAIVLVIGFIAIAGTHSLNPNYGGCVMLLIFFGGLGLVFLLIFVITAE